MVEGRMLARPGSDFGPHGEVTIVATDTLATTAAEAARCGAPRSCPTRPPAPPRPLPCWAGAGDGEGGGCPRLWRRH